MSELPTPLTREAPVIATISTNDAVHEAGQTDGRLVPEPAGLFSHPIRRRNGNIA